MRAPGAGGSWVSPKPRYAVVGLFLLVMAGLFVFFVAWMYGYRKGVEFRTCVILTEESVGGVRIGSPVRYKGIDVGKVSGLEIYKEDPNVVVIYLKVRRDVPIHRDTRARIVPMGITGLAYIGLTGGREGEPYLVKIGGREYPLIRLELSEFQRVYRSLPEVLARVDELVGRMNRLFSDRNIHLVNRALVKLVVLEERLKGLSAKLERLADRYRSTGEKVDRVLGKVEVSADSFKSLLTGMENGTLREIDHLLAELKRTVRDADILLRRISDNPSILLYGYQATEGPGERER